MKVLDPGHCYSLATLDGRGRSETLTFVKREGELYPGNVGAYAGTTTQEVLRALIERNRYVNNQLPCPETEAAIGLLEGALVLLELRAARRHERSLDLTVEAIVNGKPCPHCLHIGCLELRKS